MTITTQDNPNSMSRHPRKRLQSGKQFVAIGLSVAGTLLVLISTRWGAALSDDSFQYLSTARNLVAGNGLTYPIDGETNLPLVHFPPAFPLLLAGLELFGVDALIGARLVHALSFGLTIWLTGRLILELTDSMGFSILAGFLVLSSPVLIETYSWAMSEPLYLLLSLAGIYALWCAIREQKRTCLLLAGIASGLAFLARYIGLSLVLTGVIGLLLLRGEPWRRKLEHGALYLALSLAPMGVWTVRNLILTGSPTDRIWIWDPVRASTLTRALNSALIWFVPGRFVHGNELTWLFGLLTLSIVGWWVGTGYVRRKIAQSALGPQKGATQTVFNTLILTYLALYLATLFISRSLFDRAIPVDNRLLAPVYFSLLLLLTSALARLWALVPRISRAALLAGLILLLGLNLARSVELVTRLYSGGLGYASKGWHNSPTIAALQEFPGVPVYSNASPAIYFWTGRPAHTIHDVELMRRSMAREDAILVLFNSIPVDLYNVTLEELILQTTLHNQFRDGAIFTAIE